MEHRPSSLPIRRNRIEQRDEIRWPDDRNTCRVDVWRERQSGQRCIAAIAAAEDPDALWIGSALLDEVFHAPSEIVLHLLAPLQIAGIEKLLAIAGGGSEVRLQHGVAAVGQELCERAVAP